MTKPEIQDLLLAEFGYWQNVKPPVGGDGGHVFNSITIGATAAISNVIGALNGHPAPWHPKQTKEPAPPEKGGNRCLTSPR